MTITAREMYLMGCAYEMGTNHANYSMWFSDEHAKMIESHVPESLKKSDVSRVLEEIHRESVLLGHATYAYPPEAQRVAGKILKHLWLRLADVMEGCE